MSGKLINCKYCEKEVAKGVKTCPHCGGKLKTSFLGIIFKLIGYSFLFLIGLGILGYLLDDSPSNNETNSNVITRHKLGTVASTRKFELSVVDIAIRRTVGSDFFTVTAPEGSVYVVITYTMKNISNKPIGTFSQPTYNLVDQNGIEYDRDVDASSSYATEVELTRKVLSDLNPGIKVTGAHVFNVAKNRFNPNTWTIIVNADDDVVFSLIE